MPISITLPAAYAQQDALPTLILWSKAGGSAPYGIVKQVRTARTPPDYKAYDLVLAPDTDTFVDYNYSGGTFLAFSFLVSAYPDAADWTKKVDFYVQVSLAADMRHDISALLRQLGDALDNINTEFEAGSCSIGFPNYSVNTSTLNLLVQDTEFSVQSLGPRLVSTRTWNTTPARVGLFGNGWSSPYESTLSTTCGGAELVSGSGQVQFFTAALCPDAPLAFPLAATATPGSRDKLTQGAADYWLLEKADSREISRYELVSGHLFRLASIADPNGNTLTLSYNSNGQLARVTDAVGRQLVFGYGAGNHPVSVQTPGGLQASFAYDSRGNLVRTVDLYGTEILYEYDADNLMTAMSFAGKTTRFLYDSTGGWKHLASVTDAEGQVRTYVGTLSGSRITDPRGNTTVYTRNPDGSTGAVTRPSGYVISNSYINGQLMSRRDRNENTTSFQYDGAGNLSRQTNPDGSSVNLTYNNSGQILTRSNTLGQTWTNTYDTKGNLTAMTSPLGHTTQWVYNSKGQLTRSTDANGNVTAYSYDLFGNQASVTDAKGQITRFDFGSTGLDALAVTDANGNITQFSYDANRRITRITHPDGSHRDATYDGCARVGLRDENGNSLGFTHDKLLRDVAVTEPTAAVTTKSYDGNGNLLDSRDALGQVSSLSYDMDDRLATRTNALGGVIEFSRDGNGNVLRVLDERRKATAFAFDVNNRVSSATDPLGRMVRLNRDTQGRITSKVNARGGTLGLTYDADGHLLTKTLDAAIFTYRYDAVGNLTALVDGRGTTTFSYDGRNKVIAIDYPDGKQVGFAYDNTGRLRSITYPGGVTLTYGRTNRNWISTMAWGNQALNFAYDPVGNLLSEGRSNFTTSAYLFDVSNRMIKFEHKRGATVFASAIYTRDAVGRTTTAVTVPSTVLSQPAKSRFAVLDDANQIQSFDGSSYSYDADGNLTGITGTPTFAATYDTSNRLLRLTRGGLTSDYGYDAQGNRVWATRDGVTTRYYHDADGRLLFEADTNGAVQALYFYRDATLVAKQSAAGVSHFYHHDQIGNVLAITDASGNVLNSYVYSPYGGIVTSTESLANRFKFVGAYGVMDEGGSLYLMRHRFYDTASARFFQRDPIGFAAGQANLYTYAGGNPVERIDPYGTSWLEWIKEVLGFKHDVDEARKAKAERAAHIERVGLLAAAEDGSLDADRRARGQAACAIGTRASKLVIDAGKNAGGTGINALAGGGVIGGIVLGGAIDQLTKP